MLIENIEDIKNLISQCEDNHAPLHIKEYLDLQTTQCEISVIMDEIGENYAYCIPIETIIGKNIPNACIIKRKWELSKDESKILMKIE